MLGNNIRKYRKDKKLTIKELAERTGLSIGYISQVERGETEPSLSSLRKIAKEFEIPSYILLDDYKGEDHLTLRKQERIQVRTGKNTFQYEFLTPLPSQNFHPKALMLKVYMEPHSRDAEIPLVHHSEETLLVLKGTLTVAIGDDLITLEEGDTTLIKEDLPHICINNTDEKVEVLSVITPPVWGTLHFPG